MFEIKVHVYHHICQQEQGIKELLQTMSQEIEDFKTQVSDKFATISANLNSMGTSLTNINTDQQTLLQKIQDLINNPPGGQPLSEADKTALTEILALATSAADQTSSLSSQAASIDVAVPGADSGGPV